MSDEKSPLASEMAALIFVGKLSRVFEVLGQKVEFQTLDSQTLSEIAGQCSGLDVLARERRYSILSVAYSLARIGNYTFTKLEEKLNWVGRLQEPVLDLFVGHYVALRKEQRRLVDERADEIKKSPPIQSPVDSGDSSSSSQGT